MATNNKLLTPRLQVWVDARSKFRLSHAHIQMARELGLNPKKLGSLANHDQEKWKSPLPQFIEGLYHERFGRDSPPPRDECRENKVAPFPQKNIFSPRD
jgi:hypothetical protein